MTGFKELDDLTGGFYRGELICIAGRPSMGKTGLVLSILDRACVNGEKNCLYFSLAENVECILMRMTAIASGEDPYTFRSNNTDNPMFKVPMKRIEKAEIYINDRAYTIRGIEKTCKKLSGKTCIDLVVVDYLQLVLEDGHGIADTDISGIVNRLKQLARKLKCPVVVLSMLGRGVENREDHIPRITDLKEYGGLYCYSDKVIFIYRDDYYNIDTDKRGEAEIIVAKNNLRHIGTVTLKHSWGGAFDDMHNKQLYFKDFWE